MALHHATTDPLTLQRCAALSIEQPLYSSHTNVNESCSFIKLRPSSPTPYHGESGHEHRLPNHMELPENVDCTSYSKFINKQYVHRTTPPLQAQLDASSLNPNWSTSRLLLRSKCCNGPGSLARSGMCWYPLSTSQLEGCSMVHM